MRLTTRSVAALAALTVAACSDTTSTAAPTAATFAALRTPSPDTVGTPDLIVDARRLATSWEVGAEFFAATSCSTIEGGIEPGEHRALRFTVATPNIGTADLYVGDPAAHFDPNGDGDPSDGDGLFEFASCHEHYHFLNYATYELYPVLADGALGTPIRSAKQGFCMRDNKQVGGPHRRPYYLECGAPARNGVPAIPGNQGISTGWSDIYANSLPGQLFIVDGLSPGDYLIRITANPPFAAQPGAVCPHTDAQGFCHMFEESDYGNNVAETRIRLQ
ncbi:MAG TPA: lysyl oxidase family protein [Gemmatimonadaceae bacterium]|nr:lysyl oxidase family protein [Gemmatimonadaceae bacterium]